MIPRQIGLALSVILFAVPAALLLIARRSIVPLLVAQNWDPLLAWFVAGGEVLALMLVAALAAARMAVAVASWRQVLTELRLHPAGAGFGMSQASSLAPRSQRPRAFSSSTQLSVQDFRLTLPFLRIVPLEPSRLHLLALWLPFFFLNIVGEELWWRGFIQPAAGADLRHCHLGSFGDYSMVPSTSASVWGCSS
ncbi:MAG: hypothetical protein ACREDO_11405 [Methyloceanibacter sp.]